jgi:hypothetical protein
MSQVKESNIIPKIDLQNAPIEDKLSYRLKLIRASSHTTSQKSEWINEALLEYSTALNRELIANGGL